MKVFRKSYPIEFYQVAFDKKLHLYALMNMVQDVASVHAHLLGFGHDHLNANTHWVLVRQKLQMSYWPSWGETIEIETFIGKAKFGTPPRDLRFYHKGNLIGVGQTTWLVIDALTRRPATQKIDELLDCAVDDSSGISTEKITFPAGDFAPVKIYNVELSDLDMNLHVNNANYGQWITNTIGLEILKFWSLTSFSINYLQEVLPNDLIEMRQVINDSENMREIRIEGKQKNNTKAAFTALVTLVKKV